MKYMYTYEKTKLFHKIFVASYTAGSDF